MSRHFRFAVVLFCGLILAAVSSAAIAGPFEDALPKFTTDSLSDTGEAVEAIANSGSPRAVDVVQALQDGRLLFDAAGKKGEASAADVHASSAAAAASIKAAQEEHEKLMKHLKVAKPSAVAASRAYSASCAASAA